MLTVRDLHAYYGKSHILQGVSMDVGAVVGVPVTRRLAIEVTGVASAALTRQRYLVGGTPVFELPGVEWQAGLAVSVLVF